MRSIFAEDFFSEDDAGGVNDSAQSAELYSHVQPAAHARFVSNVDTRESRAAAKLGHQAHAKCLINVGDQNARPRFDEHACRRFAESRGAARYEEDVGLKLQRATG